MIGMPNINQYFKVAMGYPIAKLQAIIRGQDHSIPAIAAMAAFEIKGPMEIAAKAQQALQKQSPISVRDKLAQEGEEKGGMLPDNAMMAMQQQQQGSLPENTGIGQLPAPNMQTMNAANGGIIAFDDGGYVPGYAGSDLFARSDVDEEEVAALDADQVLPPGRGRGAAPKGGMPEKTRKFLENKDKPKEKTKGRAGVPIKDTNILDELIGAPTPSPNRPSGAAPEAPIISQAGIDKLMQANRDMQNMPRETVPNTLSAPPTEKRTAPAVRATPAAPQGTDTEQQMADTLSKISGTRDAEIKSQYADFEKKTGEGIAALRTERERGRPTGKAFEGLETELKEEKDAVKGKEAKNLQMALINAGLAIAGGSSRYAMENIGKGALVGTKQYMDGLDKLEAAAKERRKMTAMIEEARRAEARGDFKEKNEFETKAFELGVNSRKASIDGLAKIYDTDKKAAVDIFNRLEQDKNANIRNRETVQGHLAGQSMMAAAYGQRANDPMALRKAAMDDALQAWTAEQKDKTFMLLKPEQKALRQRQIYERTFGAYGLASPFGGGSAPAGNAPAGGGQRPPLSQRTDLFQ
jgi:hypothetical protein